MVLDGENMTEEVKNEDGTSPSDREVTRAAAVLRAGGIVAYPTDTVYGLGADIYNAEAVRKVFLAKSRPLTLPLPILIADTADISQLVDSLPPTAVTLMHKFWPGGLTIIFNKAPGLHSLALANSSKVAVRLPEHPLTRKLIALAGNPIVGTSANLHGREPALTAAKVKAQLGSSVDFIVAGGTCPGGIESTIIDVTVDPPVILRPGMLPQHTIFTAIATGREG